MASLFAAAADPATLVPAGAGLLGATAAFIALLRYVKRTEDSTVDGLVDTVKRLDERCERCEKDNRALRTETYLLHRQIGSLRRAMAREGIAIPDDYPTT